MRSPWNCQSDGGMGCGRPELKRAESVLGQESLATAIGTVFGSDNLVDTDEGDRRSA